MFRVSPQNECLSLDRVEDQTIRCDQIDDDADEDANDDDDDARAETRACVSLIERPQYK